MAELNYHHLLYFYEIARHRSVSRAARELAVSQPTASAQLKALEGAIGESLFIRTGRQLVLTEVGQTVFDYATEIFSLGRELEDAISTRRTGRALRLRIGVDDAMPKLVAHALIRPALSLGQDFRLLVRGDRHDRLLADLQAHQFDVLLTHEPAPATAQYKGLGYALGESGVSFLTAGDLHRRLSGTFPTMLDNAAIFLPAPESSLRRALDNWFSQVGVRPVVAGEFSNSCMLKTFGQSGAAIFPCLTLVEKQVMQQYRARVIGRTQDVRERFFAVASGKRLTHPGVIAICRQPRLMAELVDGMPITDMGMLKEIAKRLRRRHAR